MIFTLVLACSNSFTQKVTNSNSKVQSTECRVVQHARGESCIPLNPKRIVTLDFNSFATVLALGIKPIATWVTTEIEDDFRYFQSKVDGIEILRSSSGQINLEKLVLLHPDLIIVISHPFFEGVYKYASQIAPTVVLPWIEHRGNWKQHIQDAAKVLERTEMATQIMNDYNRRVQEVKQLLVNKKRSLRISFAYVASGQLVITRKKSFAGGILDDIGLLNPIFEESRDKHLADLLISEELLPKIDSDILFVAPLRKGDRSIIKRLQQKPLWNKLKAVQQEQVYLVDFSVWRGLNILAAHEMLNDLSKYLVRTYA
ncbi:iron-siderophore ABC transporter substrate-binding protein [Chlorogloeopsis sp. ULAP01]|uniref:iron-siderophore ABC transporter substrate-binding protein n=1 Tax=Chlorogloeopsis sp. ULAP01 TaxID=3056483 RepID=UPI0025AAB821|nr:iron-siderophore ABC transporter substrate-binding protein [Chlorogloeopsis sp. ULAP01]MDM9382662.1 iron-siderophore ABC transporter substrate-binding protein [Chlorogloeopsis sp. ULAP01]